MGHWNYLKPGSIVDVISPGYASSPEDIEKARKYLLKIGLVPRIPKQLVQKHYMFANSDEKRFQFVKEALLAPDSDVVWCMRGGYGSNRLLPMLDKVKKPKKQKLLVGISDITSLHVYLHQKWGWQTFHASLLDRLGGGRLPAKAEKETLDLLFGRKDVVEFHKLKPMNGAARSLKSVKSSVVGGNMMVLQSTLGTPYQLETDGKLLFIEELCERGYRIDRILEQFDQAGLFKKCKGLLLGDFLEGKESDGKPLWPKVLKDWAADLKIPVFSGVESGHDLNLRPLPFWTKAELQGGARGVLRVHGEGK